MNAKLIEMEENQQMMSEQGLNRRKRRIRNSFCELI